MKNILRTLLVPTALAAVAAAQASVSLYYAFDTTPAVPLTNLPITATSTPLSLYFTSTTALDSAELFLGYDTATSQGTGATTIDRRVSLTSATAASGIVFNTVSGGVTMRTGGGVGTGTRAYGLDIPAVSGTSGILASAATTAPVKLLTVNLNNLALSLGSSYTLTLPTTAGGSFTNIFADTSGNSQSITSTSLTVTSVNPTPEPGTIAALGLGAVAFLRRRKRA